MPYKRKKPDVRVDKEKLKEALKKSGKSLPKASLEMGYSKNYLSDAARRGTLRSSAMTLLTQMYGIKAGDIEAPEVPPPAEPKAEKPTTQEEHNDSDASVLKELKRMNSKLDKTNETLISIAKLLGMTIRILK